MSLLVQGRVLAQLDTVHYERDLTLRVEQGKAPYAMRVYPYGTDEPVSVRFSGRAAVKSSSQMFEGAAEIVVTRLRLILLVKSGMNARGLSQKAGEVVIVSVDRADLGPPQRINTRFGKLKRVEFAGSTDPFVMQILYLPNFEAFLQAMTPEYAQRLGHERAAELYEAKRLEGAQGREATKVAEAGRKQTEGGQFGNGDQQSSRRGPAGLSFIVKLLGSGVGQLGLAGACAVIGAALILLGNYIQNYYAAEQVRCNAVVRPSAACISGSVATSIGGDIAKTGWVVLFFPVIVLVTYIVLVRRKKAKVARARSTDRPSRTRKPSEPDQLTDRRR